MKRGICLALVISTVFGCGREGLDEYDGNFAGEWRNKDTLQVSAGVNVTCYMLVDPDGEDKVEMFCDSDGMCQEVGYGRVLINKDRNKILISSPRSGRKREFDINRFPFQDTSGRWLCVIENTWMIRDP